MAIVPKTQVSAAYYVQHPLDLIRGLSSDVVALAVIFFGIAAYGLYRGKESLTSLLVSLYLGLSIYSSSEFLRSLIFFRQSNIQIFFSKAIVYLIVVIIINFVIGKIIGTTFAMSKVKNWLEIAVLSISISISAIVIAFNALSLSLAYSPSLVPASFLASGDTLLWAFVGSLIVLFYAARQSI